MLKYISRQFSKPTGFGGKISTFIMNRLNQKLYKTVIENIDIQTTDAILDIGFGNGYLIRKLSDKNLQKIYGVDISPYMLDVATEKNKKIRAQGKMQLLLADVQNLPLEDSSIDKAYTVNTVYFWQDIRKGFSEIKRILKPNGIFIHIIYLKNWLDKLPITQYGFSKYTIEQIEEITAESGLSIEKAFEIEAGKSACVVAKR
jgi:ubiquinone/menaquinone biosynthesis C-methylase UbiE